MQQDTSNNIEPDPVQQSISGFSYESLNLRTALIVAHTPFIECVYSQDFRKLALVFRGYDKTGNSAVLPTTNLRFSQRKLDVPEFPKKFLKNSLNGSAELFGKKILVVVSILPEVRLEVCSSLTYPI